MKFNVVLFFFFLPFLAFAKDPIPKSIYDFKVKALNGSTIDFAQFRGKKILIVNTTSMATDNPQYAQLEAVSKKYKDKLVVVGFLSVDYLKPPHAHGKVDFSARDVSEYKVTFPLAAQVVVAGPNISPVYKWLTDVNYNKYKDTEIKWDFQKYLINENGELVAEFDPKIKVTDPGVIQEIEQ